jgi:hypothetical protein
VNKCQATYQDARNKLELAKEQAILKGKEGADAAAKGSNPSGTTRRVGYGVRCDGSRCRWNRCCSRCRDRKPYRCSTLLITVPHVLLALARLSPVAKQLWIDTLPAVHVCAEKCKPYRDSLLSDVALLSFCSFYHGKRFGWVTTRLSISYE